MKWSLFVKNKGDLPSEMLNFIKKISNQGFSLDKVRLDNSGENMKFQELMVKNNYGNVKFEFTAPRTPQQNGVVERAFATLLGRMRAMMSSAGLTKNLRGLLWAECARTATMLENSMQDEVEVPIKLYADNVGALFLAENASVGQRTKHIDVRYHFIRDLVQNGTLQIIFVKTTENDADIYTKNVTGDVFEKHISKYMELGIT
jgi:hypothetical protein